MNSKNQVNCLDFQAPEKIDEQLLDVPGFVNELKDHTLAVSPRPNPVTAFAGALAMQSHLTGARFVDVRGLHTNLYLAALAPTGMGKDEPRVTNKTLAAAIGALGSVPDAIASGEALEDALAVHPSLLLQCDEADSLLTAMRGGDSRASKLNEMVLRLYSEAKSGHAMRLKAGDTATRVIERPHLTLFATGIAKFVYGALSAKALENGLLGRCLFLETNEFRPLGDGIARDLPPRLVETAAQLAKLEREYRESGTYEPIVIGETAEASELIKSLRNQADASAQDSFERQLDTAAALYCRLHEKTLKFAAHYAISSEWRQPVIDVRAVEWGAALAKRITDQMLYESQFHVAEGSFDKLKKRILGMLSRNGGQIDRSTLLRNLPVDATMLRKILTTLKACDLIEDEVIPSGKVVVLLKNAG